MSSVGFAEFFSAVHGTSPFPWQEELARLVAEEGWPESIVVPTGLGKTAVLDVAVWALAREAELPATERTAPARTFLIVDRRLVVDQAEERARALSKMLQDPTEGGPVDEVARALRSIGSPADGEPVLTVTRMRGGTTWASRWVRRPDLPAIVIGTVDQLGSRALFRGYGVGRRRLPMDAALVGKDSLVIVDEVHLSRACFETLETARAHEAAAVSAAGRPLRLVRMSATLPDAGGPSIVGERDYEHGVAGPRLLAAKSARLAVTDRKAAARVLAGLAKCHLVAESSGPVDSVAVVVNTVALAREVFELLRRERGGAVLLVGRVRGADRERTSARLAPFKAGKSRSPEDPRFLVATQTVEVGVDLDVGALVSQAAPLDSLVQRLGRLDRLGRRERTEATLVRIGTDDPVYGAPSDATWRVLTDIAGGVPALTGPPRSLDELGPPPLALGTEALETTLAGVDRSLLVARSDPGPVLLQPILDVWARTAPLPVPDEPVAAYLHGFERASPLVSIMWRAVAEPSVEALRGSVASVKPRSAEQVDVPVWEAIALLEGRRVEAGPDVAAGPGDTDAAEPRFVVPCLRIDGDDPVACGSRTDVGPGAILVVPSSIGGYDEWGWTGRQGGSVRDVADLVPPGGTLRLQAPVFESLGLEVSQEALAGLDQEVRAQRASDDDVDVEAVRDVLRPVLEAVAEGLDASGETSGREALGLLDGLLLGGLDDVPRVGTLVLASDTEAKADLVLRWRPSSRARVDLEFSDGEAGRDDDADCATSRTGTVVTLAQHSRAVGDRARDIAERIGLDAALVDAVALAGLGHDLGKADARFQLSLWRGDRLAMEADGRVLAKSGRPGGRHTRDWPRGLRHEALSATAVDDLVAGFPREVDVALVRHLVVAHHGHGRPLLPPASTGACRPFTVASPDGAGMLSLPGIESQVDWEHPRVFSELCRRYGWWGLALLETIVPGAADICASEEGT